MEFLAIVFFIIVVIFLFTAFFTVNQQTNAVLEIFGKFSRIATPGLNLKIPFIEKVVARVNLRIQQLNITVETKTRDNVFVHIIVSVQYFVIPANVYDAFYKLNNPESQITSFVFDVVRAEVPKIDLDDVFLRKDDIAVAVKNELSHVMSDFGYEIIKTLVTDINPDAKVKESMNEINAAQRMRMAAMEKAEADKIMKVKSAEGDAESKALQGKGIADQRQAIVDGLRKSVDSFQNNVNGISTREVMNMIILTQYLDTLRSIGSDAKSNTILIPHSPSAVNDLASQIRDSLIIANEVDNSTHSK
jgi:regulator of protease activity HflC (stomatin/prohibitin superfamily)